MLSFSTYLVESLDVDKLKHLEHAEDHVLHGGEEGLVHASDNLEDLHNMLLGSKKGKSKVTVKYDGSPSVVFGVNPDNGKFFVASKSAFNKNPKINYTPEDIDRNHGHAPGLAAKLKTALEHLPKVMPTDKKGNPTGVYQGDFMYDKGDLDDSGDSYRFAPNTITYSAKKDSAMGRRVGSSNMGFVVHTKYTGKNLADMKAGFDVDHSQFKHDPSVNMVNPEINDTSKSRYTPELRKQYQDSIQRATELYRDTDSQTFRDMEKHQDLLKQYINQTVRDRSKPSIRDYASFLASKRDAEVAKLKTDAARNKKAEAYNPLIDEVTDKAKSKEFDKVLGIHASLQKAKDALVQALGNPTEFEHTVGGKQVKPEGFVSIRNGRPTKLVDRAEFSALNFANNRGKGNADEFTRSDVESQSEPQTSKPHVFAFGRMNPPTVGHGALVDKVKEVAAAHNAGHSVVLSGSQDPEKNPLSPEEKLKHAQRFFPGTNISVADKSTPTFIHHAKKLHQDGVDHLIMVAGSDRVDEYKKLLDQYNGEGPNKQFNFKKIDVVSAGQRDPDAEGVSGMSASKMRGHAGGGKFSEFRKGVPGHVSDDHAREMYNDVRRNMFNIEIGPKTSGISLARYAQRKDVVGTRARAEMKRREVEKASKAAIKKPRKPKQVTEEMTSTGGDVRGLGFVTGDPMVSGQFAMTWATLNAADADTKDQLFIATKKSNHDDLHGNFKQPEQLSDKSKTYRDIIDRIRGKR